jgi:hypothetical protein
MHIVCWRATATVHVCLHINLLIKSLFRAHFTLKVYNLLQTLIKSGYIISIKTGFHHKKELIQIKLKEMSLKFWKLKIFSHNLRLSVLTLHAVNKTMSQVKIAYDCQKEYLCKSLSWSMESSHLRYWKLLNSPTTMSPRVFLCLTKGGQKAFRSRKVNFMSKGTPVGPLNKYSEKL